MLQYVRVNKFSELSGYTPKAVERKIEAGVWAEGRHYIRSPDGRIHIDLKEYEKWLLSTQG